MMILLSYKFLYQILIERCPELLNMGDLAGWNLSPDDVILLNGILRSNNSSIILSITNIGV